MCLPDQALRLLFAGKIGLEQQRLPARRLDLLGYALRLSPSVTIVDQDPRALSSKGQSQRASNPPARAGDYNILFFKHGLPLQSPNLYHTCDVSRET